MAELDHTDRALLALLQQDATQSYAALGAAVALSTAATHDRVRKLRERGVIRRTTVEIDPLAVGLPVLAFVLVDAGAWMGGPDVAEALRQLPCTEEAHIVAGSASLLLKVRAADTAQLQDELRRVHAVAGVRGTNAIVVLEVIFERGTHIDATPTPTISP